ncbi:MAG: hypothetical protein ABW007_27715 [Chitinophagaceae bacterium]
MDDFMDAESTTDFLIDGAAEKVQWARKMANEFLEHAAYLRDRADAYTHLAGTMIVEANNHAAEIANLVNAEFPTLDDVQEMQSE